MFRPATELLSARTHKAAPLIPAWAAFGASRGPERCAMAASSLSSFSFNSPAVYAPSRWMVNVAIENASRVLLGPTGGKSAVQVDQARLGPVRSVARPAFPRRGDDSRSNRVKHGLVTASQDRSYPIFHRSCGGRRNAGALPSRAHPTGLDCPCDMRLAARGHPCHAAIGRSGWPRVMLPESALPTDGGKQPTCAPATFARGAGHEGSERILPGRGMPRGKACR